MLLPHPCLTGAPLLVLSRAFLFLLSSRLFPHPLPPAKINSYSLAHHPSEHQSSALLCHYWASKTEYQERCKLGTRRDFLTGPRATGFGECRKAACPSGARLWFCRVRESIL